MPGITAGMEVEVSVSAGFEMVKLTIRDPGGVPVRSKWSGLAIDHMESISGYHDQTFIANIAGEYSVEVEGGGSLTTVNSWRR